MTVRQIGHGTRKYVWDTADTKPTAASHGCQVGDTGYDRQTGIMYITYDGTNWVEKDTVVRLETSPTIDIGDVTLLAGTALVGKVGIDQTTPGTTNRVDIGIDTGAYTTPTHTQPSITAATTEALAANANRLYALLVNDSVETLYIKLGAAAVLNQGIRLNANGGSYEMSKKFGNLYTGAINAIGTSGAAVLDVTEGV